MGLGRNELFVGEKFINYNQLHQQANELLPNDSLTIDYEVSSMIQNKWE